MKVELVNAEVLIVAPDEVLIVKVGRELWNDKALGQLMEDLVATGLRDDQFLIVAGEMEFTKVKR